MISGLTANVPLIPDVHKCVRAKVDRQSQYTDIVGVEHAVHPAVHLPFSYHLRVPPRDLFDKLFRAAIRRETQERLAPDGQFSQSLEVSLSAEGPGAGLLLIITLGPAPSKVELPKVLPCFARVESLKVAYANERRC
jgi:hypothetical protein